MHHVLMKDVDTCGTCFREVIAVTSRFACHASVLCWQQQGQQQQQQQQYYVYCTSLRTAWWIVMTCSDNNGI
jgi:hypothetical protein